MNVSFFGNDRQFNNLKEEWMERASSVWSTGQFLFGPSVEKLEKGLAKKTNRKYCVALASCTDALSIALHYLSLPVSSQVMVTNYSFLASATPILKNNLTPHFVDIDGEAFHPLTKEYRAAEADEAKAMIAVSLFGTPSDMGEIERFAEEKKIPLIEDAAQSFGSFNKGRPAGSFGFASCISFDPTKVLAASSSGGALLTDDEGLFKFARQIRLHGKNQKGEFTEIGGKSLISSVEAELLNMKLEYLDGWLARREEIASFYINELKSIDDFKVPCVMPDNTHTFHKFVVQTSRRDQLFDYLSKNGITPRKHYQRIISQEAIFQEYPAHTPKAERMCKKVLSLPLYQELTDVEVEYVASTIKDFFNQVK